MNKLTVDNVMMTGKRVLTRVDFNVPLKGGVVSDDSRITAALPTIRKIMAEGGRLILMSHLGRPKGQAKLEYSLRPVANHLTKLLGKPVAFVDDCVGPEVKKAVSNLKNGEVLLLENVRFHKEETDNDPEFARELAQLGDIYVNDAFGSAHRAHASTAGVTRYLKTAMAGYLMQKEIAYLGNAVSNPKRPFVAIIGGAKISGKIDVIKNLIQKVDTLILGGGMIFTFYKAMGLSIGNSLLEEDKIADADNLLKMDLPDGVRIVLPEDLLIANQLEKPFETREVSTSNIPEGWIGVDIGPKSQSNFIDIINSAKTIVWNGPMGIFETEEFAKGTLAVGKAIADITAKGAISVVGGGDSVAALAQMGLKDKVSHASTGGGASLEYLEGKTLPGLAALTDKSRQETMLYV